MRKFTQFVAIVAFALVASAAAANPVAGVTIKDYSSQLDNFGYTRDASHTIDGSGLSSGNHSSTPDGTMWLTRGNANFYPPNDPLPAFITFDLGQNYSLSGIHVWNYNEDGFTSRSAASVEILVSSTTNVGDLVRLDNSGSDFLFTQATGQSDYAGFQLNLSGVTNPELLQDARLVRFNILSNYGDTNAFVGLSEVQFAAAVPESGVFFGLFVVLCVAVFCQKRTAIFFPAAAEITARRDEVCRFG